VSYITDTTCPHVTEVIEQYARLLEQVADAQNTLAVECDSELAHLIAKQLFRHVKRACDSLGQFLKDHDASGYVERPQLVLLPPAEEL
jgi:hypothetical protein